MDRKRLIIIIATVLLLGLIATVIVLVNMEDSNEPVKTTVPQGEVVQPNNGNQNGTGNGSEQPGSTDGDGSDSSQSGSKPVTNAELSVTVQKSASYLSKSNGQPAFSIVKVAKPLPGWYVITIVVNGQRGKVILKQTNDPNNPLTVVAGPGTYFPPEDFSFPDEVRKAL